MKSKSYTMWICDTCEDGIEHGTKKTLTWKGKTHKCIFCKKGTMKKEDDVTFEIIDKQ